MAGRRRLFQTSATNQVDANCGPWYRESLPRNRLIFPLSLNTKQWVFLRSGQDDFRYGCPPCDSIITWGLQGNSVPQIYHQIFRPSPPRRKKNMPTESVLCSKLSPAQQARKAFVEAIEAQLTPHPLARYPNLEEEMPAELLLKVLEVLDPDRKLQDTWAHCEGTREKPKEPVKCFKKRSTQDHLGLPKRTHLSHPGSLFNKEKKPSEMDSLHGGGSLAYEKARKTVSDFCKWASDVGSAKIDEEYVMKQFTVDYQSKPSCYGLRTVRPDQVPQELRRTVGPKKRQEAEFFQEWKRKPENPSNPKYVKMRYGAWYLHPKLWKRQRADEPLIDPKVLRKAEEENLRKEKQKQEELLAFAKLYGPVAFKEFIIRKGCRMPTFLEKINVKKEGKCECKKTPMK